MHKPESVRGNEMYKTLRYFEVQMDHIILARKPNLVLISKEKKELVDFAVSLSHWVRIKENKMIDKYFGLC